MTAPATPGRPAVRVPAAAGVALTLASLMGLASFGWPFLLDPAAGDGSVSHGADAPWVFVLILPLLVAVVLAEVNAGGLDAKAVALLGMLAAIGGALRALSPGIAGLEPSFVVIILGGRVFGRGFGFVLGCLSLFVGALVTGGVGPWLPFQMIAAGWVGLAAGFLPRRATGRAEVALLASLGLVLGIAYGVLMNMWFWPFAQYGDGLTFDGAAGLASERRRLPEVLPGDLAGVGRQPRHQQLPPAAARGTPPAAGAAPGLAAGGLRRHPGVRAGRPRARGRRPGGALGAMRVRLLGTGSADGWPNAFCACASCACERAAGRTRAQSGALVDDAVLLDGGATAGWAASRSGADLAGVRLLLLTHQHTDHAHPAGLLYRSWAGGGPLTVAGPPDVVEACRPWLPPETDVELRAVAPGDVVERGGYAARALPAAHGTGLGAPGTAGRRAVGGDGAAAARGCCGPPTRGRCRRRRWPPPRGRRTTWCCSRRRSATGSTTAPGTSTWRRSPRSSRGCAPRAR